MPSDHQTPRIDTSHRTDRRAFVRLITGASLGLAGAVLAACAGNKQAQSGAKRPKTYIRGNNGGGNR